MSIAREKLLKKFGEEYGRLNDQQRKAVDQIEGPVLVIAGPGTGKTQILSVRIGKILLDTDVLPSNILCLTYTDAGVLAMRKRLLSMIGPDAYAVPIHSFHSFCNMVIQQNRHLFHKKDLQPINELEQAECLMQLIDGLADGNPLKRYKTDAYFESGFLKELFSAMKREGWTPAFLTEKIREYVEDIIPETFLNKIKIKKNIRELTAEGRKEIEKMEKLQAAVNLFEKYQAILKERQRYDFDDMINWVIGVFQAHPDVLAIYQEQFQYFLVDEYQDTSGSQNRLVELLVSYWETPNLFVVGDDDQSIYRFQGANMENMRQLAKKYEKDLLRVVLTENYRSVQPILDAAHLLISNNQQRLINEYPDLEKILTAARLKDLDLHPVIRKVQNEFEENIMVAEEVTKLVEEGVEPGKIAVIYKEHKTGEELQKFLQLQQIQVYSRKQVNLLKDPFIKKVLCYIRWVIAEQDVPFSGDHCLFEILHHHFHGLPPIRIATICNEVNNNRRGSGPKSVYEYLGNMAREQEGKLFSSDEITDKLVAVYRLLERLVKDAHNLPLLKWLEVLFNEAGMLSWIMNQPEKSWLMQLLNGFFDYVQDECRRNPDLDLKGLVRQISLLEDNGLSIPLFQTSGNEKGVHFLTCHGSKGLEYEYVFLVGAHSAIWEAKRKNSYGYKLPPNVFTKETPEEKEEELRRLFFVAATRAEKHLFISYPSYTNDGKALEPSRFIAEMTETAPQAYAVDESLRLKYSMLRYGVIRQPELEEAERSFIEQLLSSFRMNVTALNNYLECPVRFYYNNLVRIPSATSEAAQFGSSMHDSISYFINKMMEEDKVYPSADVLINRFRTHIYGHREVYTPESLQRFIEHGVKCLEAYYEHAFMGRNGDFIRTEVAMEANLDNIPLKGFADKIQYWGNEVEITDFKTGSLEKSNKRCEFAEPGHPKKPEGGNYWRQAVFYKILFDRQRGKSKELRSIQFEYIEPNEKDAFDLRKVIVTPEGEQTVISQIRETWEKIQAHDFYRGCGKPECDWCNFVKDHKIYVNLHEVEETEPELRVMEE